MEVPNANLVGKHFVNHYYPNLFDNPHTIYQYYTNESRLMHVEAGSMGDTLIAKSTNEIHRLVTSLDHENCKAEILSVDALDSFSGSVFVLVTGAIHNGDITKKFVQSFYLYPGNGRYFVINDIFRYLDKEPQMAARSVDNNSDDDTYDSSQTVSSTVPEASGFTPSAVGKEAFFAEKRQFSDHFRGFVDSEEQLGTEEVMNAEKQQFSDHFREFVDSKEQLGTEEEAMNAEKRHFSDHFREFDDSEQLGTEEAMNHQVMGAFSQENLSPFEQLSLCRPPPFEEEGPAQKMSYAAILRLQSDSHTSSQTAVAFHQPVSNSEQSLSYQHNSFSQLSRARTPAKGKQEPSRARASAKAKQEPLPEEKKVDLRSVFVKNLPANIMNRQLEDVLSRFGPLRPNRLTLKSNKSGLMYAFVDFEDSTSAQAAIEASPILIGGRKVYIEKRTSVYLGDRGRGRGPR